MFSKIHQYTNLPQESHLPEGPTVISRQNADAERAVREADVMHNTKRKILSDALLQNLLLYPEKYQPYPHQPTMQLFRPA